MYTEITKYMIGFLELLSTTLGFEKHENPKTDF